MLVADNYLIKRVDVNPFLSEVEEALMPLAVQCTPEDSSPIAVIHQWVHALAFGQDFFGTSETAENDLFPTERKVSGADIHSALHESNLMLSVVDFQEKIFNDILLRPSSSPDFRFIDLFAGIGGMRLGFQGNGGVCVFSSEFEKNAQQTYLENYGELPFGDITKIDAADIPEHDILLAGFPCQPFSHAGLKLGIDDTRGTLFHDIAEILTVKRPKFAVLENVKGLISHEKGFTLQVVLRTLTRIGYSCNISKKLIKNGTAKEIQAEAKKMVLKSVDFGVPQNRQRIYIVLWQDGLIDKFDYPEPLDKMVRVGDILEENPDPKYTISDRLWAGHQRRKVQNKINGKGFGFGLVSSDSPYTNTISARYYKDGSEVLISQGDGVNPRKLTLREAARLQGFPEEFKLSKSGVQAYKQFGNSVSVPVLIALARRIKKFI